MMLAGLRAHGYLLLLLALLGAVLLGMTDSEYPYVREGVVTMLTAMVFLTVFDRPGYRVVSLIAAW